MGFPSFTAQRSSQPRVSDANAAILLRLLASSRQYMKVVCSDGANRTSTTVEAFLLTQRAENFEFFLETGLCLFYGSALSNVQAFASDGDDKEIKVIDSLQGRHGMSFHRVRCRWHLVIKKFIYRCGDFYQTDGCACFGSRTSFSAAAPLHLHACLRACDCAARLTLTCGRLPRPCLHRPTARRRAQWSRVDRVRPSAQRLLQRRV